MKKMVKVAALLAAALALFACKNIEDGGEVQQPPASEQGSGGNGGESGGEEGDTGDETVSYKDLADFFTKEYSAEFEMVTQSTNITLTAQTIKDVVEKTPAFETKVKAINTDTARDAVIAEFDKITDEDLKKAIMAQEKGYLTIKKDSNSRKGYQYNPTLRSYGSDAYPLSSVDYKISTNNFNNLSLSGEFDFNKEYIKLLSNNIDISKVEILSTGKSGNYIIGLTTKAFKELCDDLNLSKEIDILKWPTLNFAIGVGRNDEFGVKHFLDIYEKYNTSEKIQQIAGTFLELDGRELVENSSNYTLFSSDNTAKESTKATDIKSMNINTLVSFSNKYNVKIIKNIIVSDTPSAVSSVDWTNLTNVIFEGNMSNLKIVNTDDKISLNGIVYFKDSPYNSNTDTQTSLVKGALKLNKMSDTITVGGKEDGKASFVLDIRSINNFYTKYTGFFISNMINAVYFNVDQKDYINKGDGLIYGKIIDLKGGHINNVYLGEERVDINYSNITGGVETSSKTRTLKDFEYYGNNGNYKDGSPVALNNKNINFINPDTNEIIYSILNDRQYNG